MTKEQLYQRGMELFAEGSMEEAIAAFEKALEEDPEYAEALHALAMLHAQREDWDKAIELGERLVRASPQDELAHTSLSIFYQRKGLIAEAERVGAQARLLGWKRQLEEKKRPE
jgi:tetratricopeptide (TPR) repeat protein